MNSFSYYFQDEYFHVRQAQHYCNGDFHIWDPKITTPPGLYILSYIFKPILGCGIGSLRAINAICIIVLLMMLRASYSVRREANNEKGSMSGLLATHSALNIVLFPPLFFFSALYYTDIASTLSVTIFYWYFVRTLSNKRTTFIQGAIQVLLGLISLTFRQTNIFWVAVAPAALMLIVELDRGHRVVKDSMYRKAQGFGDTMFSVAKTSWKMEVIYDPPIRDAWFEGKKTMSNRKNLSSPIRQITFERSFPSLPAPAKQPHSPNVSSTLFSLCRLP